MPSPEQKSLNLFCFDFFELDLSKSVHRYQFIPINLVFSCPKRVILVYSSYFVVSFTKISVMEKVQNMFNYKEENWSLLGDDRIDKSCGILARSDLWFLQ